jgi:hypothetical protein
MDSKTTICRNCGSREFFSHEAAAYGHAKSMIPIGSFLSFPELHVRVCGGCGLIDWFASPKTLAAIRDGFDCDLAEPADQ